MKMMIKKEKNKSKLTEENPNIIRKMMVIIIKNKTKTMTKIVRYKRIKRNVKKQQRKITIKDKVKRTITIKIMMTRKIRISDQNQKTVKNLYKIKRNKKIR